MNSFLFVEYQILLFSLIVINPWNLVHHERHRQQEKFWVGIKTTKSNVNKHLTICLSSKPRNQMSTNISLSVYHQNHEIKCQQTSHYLFIHKNQFDTSRNKWNHMYFKKKYFLDFVSPWDKFIILWRWKIYQENHYVSCLVEKQLRYSSHKNLFCLITVNSQINVCFYKCKSKTPCRHVTEN